MTEFTDEQCIALAWLHGCEFYEAMGGWFVNSNGFHMGLHPLESERLSKVSGPHWGWPSREELAQDYCEWHGLLEEATCTSSQSK